MIDQKKSRHFDDKAFAALGYPMLHQVPPEYTGGAMVCGDGIAPRPDFWIAEGSIEAVCREPA